MLPLPCRQCGAVTSRGSHGTLPIGSNSPFVCSRHGAKPWLHLASRKPCATPMAPDPSLRKKLRRDQVLVFFVAQPLCVVAMEACASGHYWARKIADLGHQARPIPVRRRSARPRSARRCGSSARRAPRRGPRQWSSAPGSAGPSAHQLINALRGHLGEFAFTGGKRGSSRQADGLSQQSWV